MSEPTKDGVAAFGLGLCVVCRVADAEATMDPGERWERRVCLGCYVIGLTLALWSVVMLGTGWWLRRPWL